MIRLRSFAPFVPYLSILVGLVVFHSVWVTLIFYHVGMILYLVFNWEGKQGEFSLSVKNICLGAVAILFGIFGGVFLYFLWPFLGIALDLGEALTRLGLSGSSWIVFILYFSLVNPVLEELYWRGYLGKDASSPVVQDFLFSGYHIIILAIFVGIPWLLVVFIVLSGTAWLWRQFTRISGSLLLSSISHMAADLTVILVIYHYSGMRL